MTITLADIEFLTSPGGSQLLESLSGEDLSDNYTLTLLTALRKHYTPQQAGAALEMARLRLKAVDKFGVESNRLFFSREALEQASDPHIRRWRTSLVSPDSGRLIDACCGIGSDALAFAQAGCDVLGLDIDPARVAIARFNADVLGLKTRFEVADVTAVLPAASTIFFDPARRDAQAKRIHHVEYYQPPLSVIKQWSFDRVLVKLSPGVDLSQLEAYRGKVTFISVEGDLKEAMLMLGDVTVKNPHPNPSPSWRGALLPLAVLLVGDEVHYWNRQHEEHTVPLANPSGWLIEPDPALIRAGLVQDVTSHFEGYMLDETIAYFTTETEPDSPWLRAWQILDWMPFNLKRLRAYLRERNVGQVTVKKRGTAVTPETLIPQLKLKGDNARTLVLTRCQGQQVVLICRDRIV